jgi:arylsulfatase A-like enzyme
LHGYRTWGVGKILHGEPLHAGDPSRPIWQDFTRKTVVYPENKLNGPTGKGLGRNRVFDWGLMEGRLGDDTTIDLAVEKMRQQPDGKPVFQAVGIFSPHLPHYARKQHFAGYPIQSLTAPPMPADDYDDIPPIARETVLYQRYFNQQLFDAYAASDPGSLHKLIQSYQAAATYADEMLGRLLDELDASGRADETIIVLWSDHGYHLGDKESVIKFSLWERANHVPLIIVAPAVTTPGRRCDETVSLVDLYPTLVELAGLPPKEGLDGQSLVPLLKDPQANRNEPAITTWLEGNHAVRSKDWRYIRYRDGSEELYRDGDLWNHENLAARPESSAALKRLRKWLPEDAKQ